MKTIMEISRLIQGVSERGAWVRVGGRDHNGKPVSAAAFSERAEKIIAEFSNLVPSGEDIASRRLIVEFMGEFRNGKQVVRDGKPVTRGDGTPVLQRTFHIDKWNVLTGPTLELTRIRRDGEAVIAKAEALRTAGDLTAGYLLLAEFAAKACNRPFDLVANKIEEDEEEFGEPQPTSETAVSSTSQAAEPTSADEVTPNRVPVDPEAAAAKAYALEDFIMDPGTPAASVADKAAAAPESQETSRRAETTSGRDVLDDDAPSAQSMRRPLSRPLGGARPIAASRPAQESAPKTAASSAPAERREASVQEEAPAPVEAPVRRRIGFGMRP